MVLIQSTAPPLLDVPSNLTVPQFLLDNPYHATRPERPSIIPCLIDDDTGQKIHLDELRLRTQSLATALRANWDISEGDIVSIMSFNHIDYGPCVWAVHRVGAIVSTLSPSLSLGELVHHLKVATPVLLLVHAECLSVAIQGARSIGLSLERIVLLDAHKTRRPISYRSLNDLVTQGSQLPPFVGRSLAEDEAKTSIAFLAPSSGTTGVQKAVAISHYNVISIVIQCATFNRINEPYSSWSEQRFRPGDICFGFLPLYHIYGLVYNLHFMLYAGLSLVVAPKFHFENFLKSIERFAITHLTIVPPQAVLLSKHPAVKKYDLTSVRYCIVAAAPLSATLTTRLLEILPNVHLGQGYGMTETCGTVSMFPLSQKIGTLGSGGQLLPGTSVKVVRNDGSLAKSGEAGELYVRGGQIALGYYGDEKATRETFIDGWLRTGDQVVFQGEDIFILERIKELIKVKGFQVAPAELEGHLLGHSFIVDAAVVGTPEEFAGELPLAFVVLQPTLASTIHRDPPLAAKIERIIYDHVAKAKSKHKWLDGGIIFVDNIPRNASGKILRRILRERSKGHLPPSRSRL